MRPIDADAVYPWYIKAFSKEEIGDRAIDPRDLRFSMNDIKANLDNIPTLEQEPAWNLASEPPKDNGEYLVTRKLSKKFNIDIVDILSFNHNLFEVDKYEFAGQERAGWYDYDDEWGYFEMDDVTAWMPLPKPYKAESEGT